MSSLSLNTKARYTVLFLLLVSLTSWDRSSASNEVFGNELSTVTIRIEVNENQEIFVNEIRIPIEKLKHTLGTLPGQTRNNCLFNMQFDHKISLQFVFSIQTLLQDLGYLKVSYTDQDNQGLSLKLPLSMQQKIFKRSTKRICSIF